MKKGETRHICLIGCGRWGRNILRDLVALGCRVQVVDTDPRARDIATHFPGVLICAHVDAQKFDTDAYIIATPASTHCQIIRQVAPAGKPIFCEKPLTTDLSQASEIVATWGDRLFAMEKWRYHPGVDKIRELVQAGRIGQVKSIRTRRLQWGSPQDDIPPQWTLMPHDISIARHILGKLPPLLSASQHHCRSSLLAMTARLGPDPECTLEISVNSAHYQRTVEVHGDEGALALLSPQACELLASPVGERRFGAPPERIPFKPGQPLQSSIASFLDFVSGLGPPPLSSSAEGLESVGLITRMTELCR